MSDSTNLGLPYLAAAQSQKHVTLNESLRLLDALVQLAAVSATTSAEPGSPSDGQCYILPAGKTGSAWGAMSDGAAAYYRDGAWEQLTPREGWYAFVKDTNTSVVYDGAAWITEPVTLADDQVTFAKLLNATQPCFIGATAPGAFGERSYAQVRGDLDLEAGTDFYSIAAADSAIAAAVSNHVAASDPHTQYALESALGALASLNTVGALQIDNDAVTYAKLQNVSATSRFLGRITAGAGDAEELTGTQATSLLDALVGDSGAGGTKGLAPAPSAGDAAADKFLKADGGWAVPLKIRALEYTASGTWTKPAGLLAALVYAIGCGGGGGGGARVASGTAASGGGGGGGAGVTGGLFLAAQLGATETITIGTAGTGGAGATSAGNPGSNGTAGGNTSFGSILQAFGGGFGAGGQVAGNSGGGGGAGSNGAGSNASGATGGAAGFTGGGAGGSGTFGNGSTVALGLGGGCGGGGGGCGNGTTGSSGGIATAGIGGGGGGGGISTAPNHFNGGPGGQSLAEYTAAAAGAAGGGAGTDPGASPSKRGGGGAGGGGNTSGAGGAGAPGGAYGGGGGGGGSAIGGNGGAGGAGGGGYVLVIEFYGT